MSGVLDERVNSLLLVEGARDAGIVVDEDQVQRLVDQVWYRQLRSAATVRSSRSMTRPLRLDFGSDSSGLPSTLASVWRTASRLASSFR